MRAPITSSPCHQLPFSSSSTQVWDRYNSSSFRIDLMSFCNHVRFCVFALTWDGKERRLYIFANCHHFGLGHEGHLAKHVRDIHSVCGRHGVSQNEYVRLYPILLVRHRHHKVHELRLIIRIVLILVLILQIFILLTFEWRMILEQFPNVDAAAARISNLSL